MALSGLHVVCGYAGGRTPNTPFPLPLPASAAWSETLAVAGSTTNKAPGNDATFGQPMMSVRSSVDAWVAMGENPNATSGPRRYIAANTDYDFFVNTGDKLAWIAA